MMLYNGYKRSDNIINYNTSQIEEIVLINGYKKAMSEMIIKMCDYMNKKQWWGACSSILYVLLSEIGYKTILCVGEVKEKIIYLIIHGLK